MYNVLKELCEIVDVQYDEINNQTKIFWYNEVVVIHDYRRLLKYDSDSVIVSTQNNRLIIEGTNLKIVQISKNELIIKGKTSKVYFEK